MKVYKRILVIFLVLSMIIGLIPVNTIAVYADEKVYNNEESVSSDKKQEKETQEETSEAETSEVETSKAESTTETASTVSVKEDTKETVKETSKNIKRSSRAVAANTTLKLSDFEAYTSGNKTIEIIDAKQLVLLSYCDPSEINDITINLQFAGDADITGTKKIKLSEFLNGGSTTEEEYTFKGIGTEDTPFEGKIIGKVSTFFADNTVFGGLSSNATIELGNNKSKLNITWCGAGDVPMIAGMYQFDSNSNNGHNLPVTVVDNLKNDKANEAPATVGMGSLIGIVKSKSDIENQTLNIGNVITYGTSAVNATLSTGNAGLICNTLESGTICLDGYNFPTSAYAVKSTAEYDEDNASAAGNAGGVIGVMKNGTTLEIKNVNNINITGNTSSNNGNAGGLVGLMEQDAKIKTDVAVKLESPKITGNVSAGGAVGAAERVSFEKSKITVNSPTVIGDGANVGGFIGKYIVSTDNNFPNNIVIDSPTLTATSNGIAGGYFGYLDLKGNYTIGNIDKEIKPTYKDCSAKAIGAIVGKVTSNKIENTLLIGNMEITATNSSNKNIQYHGGLIGETDSSNPVYLEISNVKVSVTNPTATESDNYGFGGLVGFLAQGSILKSKDEVKIITIDNKINQGGGYVGYAEKSVINVTGTTDLSSATYAKDSGKNAKTGWFIGKQESALIYANGDGNGNGWSYIRGKESTTGKQAMNDIGNYGQIIRLNSGTSASKLSSDLIKINENHNIEYGKPLTSSNNTFTIDSEDVFALLSIAWNTRGYFGGVTGITSDSLKSMKITLSNNIDLTGSGITGLTRDGYSSDDIYAGTFDGGLHTITLAIGETFGFKNASTSASKGEDGYGEVISAGKLYHGRQGLFAVITNATIKNLTVDGAIDISNAGGADILVGGIAAEVGYDKVNSDLTINKVTVKENIIADCPNKMGAMIGGFVGGSYINSTIQFNGTGNGRNFAEAEIEIKNCTDTIEDTRINVGGIIGEVGERNITFEADALTVKGSITTSVKKRAYVGGLIGVIKASGDTVNHFVKIKDVIFDGFKITAETASEVCGGLFGSIWANVSVSFTNIDTNVTKLDVKDATIKASNAASVGGLAYRSSGKWEIQDRGINLEKLAINAGKDVGLLVCRGEKADDNIAGVSKTQGALYLCTTKYWDTSYKIETVNIKTKTNGVFDEFVAYTTPSAGEITDNGKNGVISIATQENTSRVGVDASGCTTYQNRTTYGQSHKTNACSRYYYDLDQCLTDATAQNGNSKLDSPQKLLLWSVYNYVYSNIKTYFSNNNRLTDITTQPKNKNNITIPWAIGNKTEMDMSKYSYYPIKYESGSVNVTDTKIIFNNENIENIEKNDNKSTQGTDAVHTQHYAMHCGLFLTYQPSKGTLTVRDTRFAGSIGKVNNNKSGVLVADFASGSRPINSEKTNQITITVTRIVFDGLKVTNHNNEYAPLLINNISNKSSEYYIYGYVKLNVNDVKIEKNSYTKGTAVASSLIGKVGYDKANQITMTFQNIILPDKMADGKSDGGIFSHATLLEQFAYSKDDNSSSATYNFYSTEDWKEEEHIHQVTYGKEITGTTEFVGLQKWYYDEDINGTPNGLIYDNINNKDKFNSSSYLPYVYTAYNKDTYMHEIKVNQRVTNIMNGCGTYGHPYRITKEQEMDVLSDYMATREPRKDWRVKITSDQNTIHVGDATTYTSDKDVVYQYNGNNSWVQVKNTSTDGKDNWQEVSGAAKLSKNFMHDYLLNAYYDIHGSVVQGSNITEPQLILTNFKGFGTDSYPFRGVITSKNNTILVLEGDDIGNGLIPYSYGSVVKNLKISYKGVGKTLTYDIANTSNCFGGVIGCILGGDNIIDGVTVEMQNDWKLTLSGEKKHLIQVGGYVGSVSGGGVIFRDMTDNTGLTDTADSNLYVNPYVGRVLDGFAFYEKTTKGVDSLDNKNKNYKINTLDTSKSDCVTIDNNIVTVKSNQGLLILSAIVNSGAASNGNSNAYSAEKANQYDTCSFGGKYGKVRNASYGKIGETGDDATLSINEDKSLLRKNNLPYLIKKYCNNEAGIFSISTNSEVGIKLESNCDYDMTTYENGYQGIGARYVSNAVHKGDKGENHPEGIIPELKTFDGNNSTVKMNMDVKEYEDDDFHAASVGGMFNVLRVSDSGTISNLTIDTGSKISLSNANSTDVGVGGFAGSLVGYTNSDGSRDIMMQKIQLNEVTVNSLASAGGIVGNTGKPATYDKTNGTNIAVLLQPQGSQITYGVAFNDCRYSKITVTGKYAAGGFVGYIGNKGQNPKSTVNEKGGTLTRPNIGENSTISATDNLSYAGGLFGYVNTRMFINMTDEGSKKDTNAILQGVNVSAGKSVGGCIGYINERCYGIHNVSVKGTTTEDVKICLNNSNVKSDFYAGGIIGYAKGANQNWTQKWTYNGGISGSSIENVKINDEEKATKHDYSGTQLIQTNYMSGGIIGKVEGDGIIQIDGCTVNASKVYGSIASGITGQTASQMEFTNCLVKGISESAKTELKGFSTAGSILGFWTGGKNVTIQRCEAQYLEIEGKDWGVGALIGDCENKWSRVGELYLFDSSVQNSNVTASGNKNSAGGRWPRVGSIVGHLRNTIKASNILVSNITLDISDGIYNQKLKSGLLFGEVVNGNINIAGISIQNIPNANKKLDLAGSDSRSVNSNNDYIAFADYSGTASDSSKQGSGTAPYVITSPKSSLALYENETDALPKYLYGDGASWTETTDVKAQEIFNNSQNENGKHYSYKNTGVTDFNFKSAISTYNDNQTTEAITNFPVLQITAGKATTVNNYLDILTNGGFTKANNLNSSDVVHVGASTEVYKYENGKFVKSSDTPALQVVKDNKKNISFSTTTDYDNGKDRFTLLTVTFTEQGHSYNVLVPVLVRRVLEIDFSATLTYGTNFDSSHYALLENHVLENFGSSITGYLTYTYNSKDGEYTDYGWQNYINAGGNVTGSINKTIVFSQDSGIIPTETQLTLISRADNRAYYYTVTGEEKNEISLSKFKNSNNESYQSPSVAELMQAVADDKGSSFIEVDANGKPTDAPQEEGKNYPLPTVKIDSKYYRLATSGENGTCDIKVDESNLKNGTKSVISESYYLVITVPKNATEALNGSIQTKIARDIPNQVHYRTIKNGEETLDNHSNTASTYLIFSGYQQNLNEENITDIYKKISTVDSTLKIDAVDEITFPNDQVYNENDQLYQRFVGGLQKTVSDKTSSEQFPSGTTGTANFYVYQKKGDKKIYYKYEKGSWSSVGETEAVAVSYQWTSTGGNMELPLSTDGTNNGAISLQEVRKFVKDNKSSENSTFYVEVRMDATIPAVGLSVIPESEVEGDVPKDFTKLVYSSQLSTEKQSLTYSNIRAQEMNTKTSYYREATTGAKLTYEANEIDQLGINLLDLRYLDVEKEHSLIDTTATYDLSALKNLEDTLKNSNGIKFTLSLMPKNIVSGSNQEEYQGALTDAENYLDVQLKSNDSGKISYQNGSWSWTVPKETYWSNDKLKTDSVFNGNFLTQSILLKVKITNIESLNHYYSNYQVSLTAEVLGKDEVAIADTNRSDNIIYTLTRINLGFVENKKESTATN